MNFPTPWLGEAHGYLSDWITQRWVEVTGRRVDPAQDDWLSGPMGRPTRIGRDFFRELAREQGLTVLDASEARGLLGDFRCLSGGGFDAEAVAPSVRDFYERTSEYDMDAWAHWSGPFRPFGSLLALIFSRRLQQLNVPLSGLDTSQGITSEIVQLADGVTGEVLYTAWVRELVGSRNVLYAGSYSLCRVPLCPGPCVKVVFPLPNGNAVVIMKPASQEGGALSLSSVGLAYGEPGFYFVVRNARGHTSARYVRAMRETIRVYPTENGDVRADHALRLWGLTFLRLHYRLRKRSPLPGARQEGGEPSTA